MLFNLSAGKLDPQRPFSRSPQNQGLRMSYMWKFIFSFVSPASTSLKRKAKNSDSIICAHRLTALSLYLCQTSAFVSFCCFSKSVIKKKRAPKSSKFATASCGKWTVTSMKKKTSKENHSKTKFSVSTCHSLSSNKTSWTKVVLEGIFLLLISKGKKQFLKETWRFF